MIDSRCDKAILVHITQSSNRKKSMLLLKGGGERKSTGAIKFYICQGRNGVKRGV